MKVAADHGDKVLQMDLDVEKSKQKLPQSEKIKWMNQAIDIGQDLDLPASLDEMKKRLYGLAPRLNPDPPERKYLSVAHDYRFARQFDKAREYYEKVVLSSGFSVDEKISALKGIRLTYKNQRLNDQLLKSSELLIKFLDRALKANKRSRSLLVASYDAQVYYGRALWTHGHASEAKALFAKLEKKMKGKVSMAELYWLKARLAEEDKDYDAVSRLLDLAIRERFNDPDLRDKVMWYSAWNERRRGNLARSIEILNEIDQKTLTDFTRQRALFWLGKAYLETKQPDKAKETFTRLMEEDPLGYYGLLAHRQLNVPITLTPPADDEPKPESSDVLDTAVADTLFEIDEKDALTAFLDYSSQLYRHKSNQADEGWTLIFKYYAKAGLYMKLYDSLGSLSPERRKAVFEHHPELLFPQPWSEEVRAAALQFGIDEELIYAIARQESAFDIHARSLADAFGLMQLLPEVAQHLSAKYNIPYTGMEDLYDPKTNIMCGAAHLKELLNRENGQFILAVASYNASEDVIHNWMKTRFHGDALEFIEEIPYEETRAYVRLVMRNLIFYSLLKSKSASITFPDKVLNLKI